MSIATRLWLAIVVSIAVVLGIGAFLRVRVEQDLLMEATLKDRRFFGLALKTVLSAARDPAERARALVNDEELKRSHIDVSVDPEGREPAWLAHAPQSDRAAFARHEVVVRNDGRRIRTVVPVIRPDLGIRAVVELDEPLDVHRAVERLALISALLQAATLMALAGAASWVLVRRLLGRPLGELARYARRIGAGELDARTEVARSDEVGILATEMNAMAEQLSSARHALNDAATERLALQEALRHNDRLRTVGQLAASLAHELGTPLNTVLGHARLIEKRVMAEDPIAHSAKMIAEQAQRMADLIRQLLDFGRRQTGSMVLQEVAPIVEKCWHLLEPLARKAGVELEFEVEGTTTARVVEGQMLQVFSNLLMNAMQAMKQGGVVRVRLATITTEPPSDVASEGERFVHVEIRDTGVGIAPEDLGHVFEPFFTRKDAGEGTGLGLPVAEGIVRSHRGWMNIESAVGRGTTVHVYLPAAQTSGGRLKTSP